MKKNWYTLILCCLVAAFSACQNEEELGNSAMGYLRLGLEVNTTSISRAEAEAYNPKQLAVQIVDASDKVVDETTNFDTEWKNKTIALPVGTYIIKASSAGFDGKTSGFDKPYYVGSTEVVIEDGKTANPKITCTLANVKVTVTFDQTFIDVFTAADVKVDDKGGDAGISPLTFTMGKTTQSGYFPVTDLKATVTATNKHQVTNTQTDEITGVKARDHYKLLYKVGKVDQGNGNVSITVDETTRTYTYVVTISTAPKTEPSLTVSSANAWAKLAYLEGTVVDNGVDLSSGTIAFQYRKKDAASWNTATASLENGTYKATVTGLEPETTYESRLVYNENVYEGTVKEFTTEAATVLYNGNFDEWYQNQSAWYPILEADATSFDNYKGYLNSFWDSGNLGAAMMSKNPTEQETLDVHTAGGSAARLTSQFVGMFGIGKFAAGNLYTGHYYETVMSPMGAKLFFGQPFTSRPTQLKGWFKYNRGTSIDRGDNPYKSQLEATGGDLCSVYIALADNVGLDGGGQNYAFEIDNTLGADDPDNFKYKNAIDFSEANPHIVAYGCITDEEAKGTGNWQEFTIDLKYRDLTRVPKYIIVVASASKYGDYFTGSESSVMYIDDFELVYDGEPAVQE